MIRNEPTIEPADYRQFCNRVAELERALWETSRQTRRARFIHSSLGHEAAAFCVTSVLVHIPALWALYYRSHAWLLALGVAPATIIDEILGESSGPLAGRGGPMHLLLHPNIIDCNSIVGAQIPIALGAAMANRGNGNPVVCVLGDGATNTGVFYEALNIASVQQIPILFVVEDNGKSMDVEYARTSSASIEAKCALFSIPCFVASANDITSALDMASRAVASAVSTPTALRVVSERLGRHVLSDETTWPLMGDVFGRQSNGV